MSKGKTKMVSGASSSISNNDVYDDMLSECATMMDLGDVDDINVDDFLGFGLMNSHMYREKLFRIIGAPKFGLTKKEIKMIFVLAIAVRSKKRVMDNIDKFSSRNWHKNVKKFYHEAVCQTPKMSTSENIFPMVNITNCNPSMCVMLFLQMYKFNSPQEAIEGLFNTLFFVQIHLSQEFIDKCKVKEEFFWSTTVTKSTVNAGANYEAGFHEDYFLTKAKDTYPLILTDGTKHAMADSGLGYNAAEVIAYTNVIMATQKKKA